MDANNKQNKRIKSPERIVFDSEYCAGCASCELSCSSAHFGIADRYLSAIRLDADFYSHSFEVHVCKQCRSASCMDACKKGAIKIDEETGARCIDQELCVNCGLCVKACPFKDEKYPLIKKTVVNDKPVIIKCDMCHGRDKGPACVEICFYNALTIR